MSFLPAYEEVEDFMRFEDTANLAQVAEVTAYNCLRTDSLPSTKAFRCAVAERHADNLEQREQQLAILNDLLADDFTAGVTQVPTDAGNPTCQAVLDTRELRSYDLRDLLTIAEDHELDLSIQYKWHGYLQVTFVPFYDHEELED